jgi:hypothetical protein
MAVFRDTDHLYQVLGALFGRVAAEPAIADRLLEGNLVVRFRYLKEGIQPYDTRRRGEQPESKAESSPRLTYHCCAMAGTGMRT